MAIWWLLFHVCSFTFAAEFLDQTEGQAGSRQHVGGDDKNDRGEDIVERALFRSKMYAKFHAEESADGASRNELKRHFPVDESGEGIVHRGCEPNGAHRKQRRSDGVHHRDSRSEHDSRYDQKPSADAEKSR